MLVAGPNSVPLFPGGAHTRLSHTQFGQLQTLAKSVFAETSYAGLFRILADFCKDIGAGAVNCAVFDNRRLELIGVSTTMNAASIDRYFAENLTEDDPLIPRIHTDPRPALLGWGFGVTPLWQKGNSARMLDAMQKDGYFGLIYFPVQVAGSPFSVSITIRNRLKPERGQAFLNACFGLLQLAADIVGQRAAALFQERLTGEHWYAFSRPVLSQREREIMCWLAEGLRTEQIAYQLNLKPVTVHMHVKSARTKLGARTREQMMAMAAQRGLLGQP
jgi:DNA-binding CsgD family transcriptional regulator